MSDKRDLQSLQREQTRLNDKSQQIQEKSQEIDPLLRQINKFEFSHLSLSLFPLCSSKLPSDSLQHLRQEIDHLKERLAQSSHDLDTRTKFIQKTIRVRKFSVNVIMILAYSHQDMEDYQGKVHGRGRLHL